MTLLIRDTLVFIGTYKIKQSNLIYPAFACSKLYCLWSNFLYFGLEFHLILFNYLYVYVSSIYIRTNVLIILVIITTSRLLYLAAFFKSLPNFGLNPLFNLLFSSHWLYLVMSRLALI